MCVNQLNLIVLQYVRKLTLDQYMHYNNILVQSKSKNHYRIKRKKTNKQPIG